MCNHRPLLQCHSVALVLCGRQHHEATAMSQTPDDERNYISQKDLGKLRVYPHVLGSCRDSVAWCTGTVPELLAITYCCILQTLVISENLEGGPSEVWA